MKKEIAGVMVDFDESNHMTDSDQWSRDIARELAREEGISELSDMHWQVLEYLRQQYETGANLSIRKIGKSGVVTIQEFYALFPDGPLKKSSRIAGIPRPASCI